MIPACPNCNARSWRLPAAVEITLELDERGITGVVAEPFVMHGEGDPVCTSCGQKLLDWSMAGDDDEWEAHHDERRPAWDELLEESRALPLPPPNTWGFAS